MPATPHLYAVPGQPLTADDLPLLLGRVVGDDAVQSALAQFARGLQPRLDPDDEELFVDWITLNEIGLEFGFEDEGYVLGKDLDQRRQGVLLLTQLYFYGDTPRTQPFPYPLPFGLAFDDDRAAVRAKLLAYEASRRSYVRDVWRLPKFTVVAAYRSDNGLLESVLCFMPASPRTPLPGAADRAQPFTPDALVSLFGQRWSSDVLRERLEPLGYVRALPEVRAHHCADLRIHHGIEFTFAAGRKVPAADLLYPDAYALAGVTFYGPRVYDARQWAGALPFGLDFEDSQADIAAKIPRRPDERLDMDRVGFVMWHLDAYTLRAEFSNIENKLLKVTIMAPGFWALSGARSHREGK